MNESSLKDLLEKASQDPELRSQLERYLRGEESPAAEALVKELQTISDEDLAHVSGGTSQDPRALMERLAEPNVRDSLIRLLGMR